MTTIKRVLLVICILSIFQRCKVNNHLPEEIYFREIYEEGAETKKVVIYIENYDIQFSKSLNENLIKLAQCYHNTYNNLSSKIWGITFVDSLKPFKGSPWWHEDIDWEKLNQSIILNIIYEVHKVENLFEVKNIEIKKGFRKYNAADIKKIVNDTFCKEKMPQGFNLFKINK